MKDSSSSNPRTVTARWHLASGSVLCISIMLPGGACGCIHTRCTHIRAPGGHHCVHLCLSSDRDSEPCPPCPHYARRICCTRRWIVQRRSYKKQRITRTHSCQVCLTNELCTQSQGEARTGRSQTTARHIGVAESALCHVHWRCCARRVDRRWSASGHSLFGSRGHSHFISRTSDTNVRVRGHCTTARSAQHFFSRRGGFRCISRYIASQHDHYRSSIAVDCISGQQKRR